MSIRSGLIASTLAASYAVLPASAQDLPSASDDVLKIGLVYTLSGPAAALGTQARDGFLLAVDRIKELGGMPTEIIIVDDEQRPDLAADKVRELVARDQVDFVVGPIFSNILGAIHKPVTETGTILISTNAGSSSYAGPECNENFFATSYQNDQNHEVMGAYAEQQGYQNVFLMAPNYQAGQDSLNGFKHSYTGGVAGEVFTELGQLDFSSELAQIAAFQPDALFTFMPGGMGVNLVKQYAQAGLTSIPFLSAFTVDETTLPATQDAAVGLMGGANWAPDLDNAANAAFVEDYLAAYDSVPGTYAMQAYDAAQLIEFGGARGRWRPQRPRRAARSTQGRRLRQPARRLQLWQQQLPDPGLLPRKGGETRRRQVPDRHRRKDLRRLQGHLRRPVPDVIRRAGGRIGWKGA